ncbi:MULTISPECIES: hypothetical protein [unclassified Curtobacterium]|uniref:AbiTii domain-containing protein n=1 Tax=unclassified Curtobacterium TaxID=257496 RepID=UPI00203FC787|nr:MULTISPECIES: hypothetical protein [unclassified Curtobacterium]MCM3522217.1 hypothetical protein [Curtobacterium sp. P97]MDB6427063.1 hypothetical protein [Curtobacterium sp. 20TX0008]
MSLLDEIIDGATNDSVSTSNLLRKVQVAAARLGAQEVVTWVRNELNGYPAVDDLPTYRAARDMIVQGVFTGPMRSSLTHDLPRPHVDAETWKPWFQSAFVQPVAELEAFADADGDSSFEWPTAIVRRYESTGTFRFEYHSLYSVHQVLTTQMLRGLVDSIRTAALDFAIELQLANPDAGSVGGPTIETDPKVASVVYNVTNNVTGHGTNIAAGSSMTQTSTVNAGDRDGLREELTKVGLDEASAEEFANALDTDRSVEGPQVKSFLGRVKSGAVKVSTDVGVKVVTGQLAALAMEYLGTLN